MTKQPFATPKSPFWCLRAAGRMVGVRAYGRDPLVQAATLDELIMDLTAVVHVHLPTNEETCFVGDGTEAR